MMNSSLKQSLAVRQSSELETLTCVTIGERASGLVVRLWQRETWVLPWTYLQAAKMAGTNESTSLLLLYSTLRVEVHGQNLQIAIDALADFRLRTLTELPAIYEAQLPLGTPFIKQILITGLKPS